MINDSKIDHRIAFIVLNQSQFMKLEIISNLIYRLFIHDSQEISSLTRQFPAPTQERKQSLEEYPVTSVTSGPDIGRGITSESTVISDSVQTGSNSPVSVFRPITAPPDTFEERTLSPPQCRLEYSNA